MYTSKGFDPLPTHVLDRRSRASAEASERVALAVGVPDRKWFFLKGNTVRTTCDSGARRLKHAAHCIAHATCARAQLAVTLALILCYENVPIFMLVRLGLRPMKTP